MSRISPLANVEPKVQIVFWLISIPWARHILGDEKGGEWVQDQRWQSVTWGGVKNKILWVTHFLNGPLVCQKEIQ